MTKPISWKLPACAVLARALSSAPAAATVKPAALDVAAHPLLLVQQQADPAADDQQKPQKKQAKKKKMSREEDAKAKARKHLPPEYHQYIPR